MRIVSLLLLIAYTISAQQHNIFFIGHSLINHELPRMFNEIAKSGNNTSHTHKEQITNGAPLKWNWDNGDQAEGHNARVEIPKGEYDVVVMTEAVPLINHLKWSDTYKYGGNYYDLAIKGNKETQVYLYETWHCINSGDTCAYDPLDSIPWRKRIDDDLMSWQGITDSINSMHDGKKMLTIPGGQAMAGLYDAIQKGSVPDLASIKDVFHDDIHLNDIGHYFIACVMYGTIYKKSPIGLTNKSNDEWGNPFDAPSPELAKKMQEIAWKTVVEYPYSGVSGNVILQKQSFIRDFPALSVQSKGGNIKVSVHNMKDVVSLQLYTPQGKMIYRQNSVSKNHTAIITSLSKGFYIARFKSGDVTITRNIFHKGL